MAISLFDTASFTLISRGRKRLVSEGRPEEQAAFTEDATNCDRFADVQAVYEKWFPGSIT